MQFRAAIEDIEPEKRVFRLAEYLNILPAPKLGSL
jgi:hypothetical protein